MCARNGVFSGIGQRPQLTSTCSRISFARASHKVRVVTTGNVRGVLRSLTTDSAPNSVKEKSRIEPSRAGQSRRFMVEIESEIGLGEKGKLQRFSKKAAFSRTRPCEKLCCSQLESAPSAVLLVAVFWVKVSFSFSAL